MPLQWFNSCGNMTLMHPSQNLSKNVWTHTVILALREPGIGSALGGWERCKTSFSSFVANSGTLALNNQYAAYGCPSKLHELHLI